MGISTVPETNNSRIRGYDHDMSEWKSVAVNSGGELSIHATVADIVQAKISGQVVRIEGYYWEQSGWKPLAVTSGGEIMVEAVAEVSGMPTWIASGNVNIMSGDVFVMSGAVHVLSGLMDVNVLSGNVHVMSGHVQILSGLMDVNVISGAVAITSGIMDVNVISGDSDVTIMSGNVHVMSGHVQILSGLMDVNVISGAVEVTSGFMDVVATSGHIDANIVSGDVFVMSGHVQILSGLMDVVATSGHIDANIVSGNVHVMSGHVQILSGLMDVNVISGAVEVTSGFMDVVATSGMVIAVTSGQQNVLLGEDFVQASGCVASGAVELIKTVTAIQTCVISGQDLTPETRLHTGADNKHIRFHEIFGANELDDAKWDTIDGTIVVTDKFAQLEDAGASTIIQTHDMFLYGVLSVNVYMEDWDDTNVRFGFVGEYAISAKDAVVEWEGRRFHTENAAQTAGDTYTSIAGLADDTWYNIQIVWTPEYAQLWINGELRAIHTDNIPQAPCRLYFETPTGLYLNVDHVSLTAYGDIPITNQGRVPVREQGKRLTAYPALPVEATSGGMVLGSGQVDRVIIKYPLVVNSGDDGWAYQQSGYFRGIWIGGASGEAPYVGSGYVLSGKGLYLAPGEQKELYVADLSEIYVASEISGDPVTYIAEVGTES